MAEKDRVEILLEQIRSDVKAVAEGHSVLHNKIDNLEKTLTEKINNSDMRLTTRINNLDMKLTMKIDNLENSVGTVAKDTKEIKQKLDEHLRFPASLAHAAV